MRGSLLAFLFVFCAFASAELGWTKGPLEPHPLSWMHELPVGEYPGWTSSHWIDLEYSRANIWGAPLNMQSNQTGKILSYFADYEQDSYTAEVGTALSDSWALSVEVPYASRDGGSLDRFISWFHRAIGAYLYYRDLYAEDQSLFQIRTDGSDQLTSPTASGFGNAKLKLKYWPVKWAKEHCPCGLGTSLQVKVPVSQVRNGLTSGGVDVSLLLEGAIPLGAESMIGLTLGLTYAPVNFLLDDWPRYKFLELAELQTEFGLGKKWAILLQGRMESPFMDLGGATYISYAPTRTDYLYERMATAFNALFRWRGYVTLGPQYSFSPRSKLSLLITEDTGLGNADEIGDHSYVNNSPDISFTLKLQQGF